MTRVIISTIRRHGPPTEPSGFVYVIDLEKQEVVQRSFIVEPVYREMDDNPRGGLRGGKGIAVRDDQIVLANFSMLCRYDPQWNLLGIVSHPSCAAIHDVLFHEDTLWIAAARTDSLMQFDLAGNLLHFYSMRQPSPALKALNWEPPVLLTEEQVRRGSTDFRDPRTHEKETHDWAHVNSLCILQDGDLLVSMGYIFGGEFAAMLRWKIRLTKMGIWPILMRGNRQVRRLLGKKSKNMDNSLVVLPAQAKSAIVSISPHGERSVCLSLEQVTAPSHSLLLLPDQTGTYLNTTEGSVLRFDPMNGHILSSTKVTDGFLRGATQISERHLLLGSRGELITYDWMAQQVTSRMQFSDDPKESVYDIKVLPAHYALPPSSFEEHLRQSTGMEVETAMKGAGKP